MSKLSIKTGQSASRSRSSKENARTPPRTTSGLSAVPLVSYDIVERAGVITIQHFDQNLLDERVRRMISFYLKKAQNNSNVHYIVLMGNPLTVGFSVGMDLEELKENLILLSPSSNTVVHQQYSQVSKVGVPAVNTSFSLTATTSGGSTPESHNSSSTSLSNKVVEGRSPTTTVKPEENDSFHSRSNVFSLNDLCSEVELSKKYVLVALHGAVLGGGLDLALSAHCRLATHDSYFGYPELLYGFLPCGGSTQRLPRLIGLRHASRLLLTGDLVGAEEAERWGLVDAVVDLEKADRVRNKLLLQAAVAYGKSILMRGKLRLYTRQTRGEELRRTFNEGGKVSNVLYNMVFFRVAEYYLKKTLPPWWSSPFFTLSAIRAAAEYNTPTLFLKGLAAEYENLLLAVNTPSTTALMYYLKNLHVCRHSVPRRFKAEYQKRKRTSTPSSRSSSVPTTGGNPNSISLSTVHAPPAGSMSIRRVAVLGCTPKALRLVAQYLYYDIPVVIIPCSLRHMSASEAAHWANSPTTAGEEPSPYSHLSPSHNEEDERDISEDKLQVMRYLEGFLAEMVMSRAGMSGGQLAVSKSSLLESCSTSIDPALQDDENYNNPDRSNIKSLRMEVEVEKIPHLKRPFTVEEVFRVQQALKQCRLLSMEDDQLSVLQDVDLIVCCRGSYLTEDERAPRSSEGTFSQREERAYSGALRFVFTLLDGRAKNNCAFLFDNYNNLCLAKGQLSEFRQDRLFMYFHYCPQPSPTAAEEKVKVIEIGCVGYSFSFTAMEALQRLYEKMGDVTVLFTRSFAFRLVHSIPESSKGIPLDDIASPPGDKKNASSDPLSPDSNPTEEKQKRKRKTTLSLDKDALETALRKSTPSASLHYSFSGIRLFARGFFHALLLLESDVMTMKAVEDSFLEFGFRQGIFLTCQAMGLRAVWYEICLQQYEQTVSYLAACGEPRQDTSSPTVERSPLYYVAVLPVVSELIQWMLTHDEGWYTQTVYEVKLKDNKQMGRKSARYCNADDGKNGGKEGEGKKETALAAGSSSREETASDLDASSYSSPREGALSPSQERKGSQVSAVRVIRKVRSTINTSVLQTLQAIRKRVYHSPTNAPLPPPYSLYRQESERARLGVVDVLRLVLCPWIQEAVHLFEGSGDASLDHTAGSGPLADSPEYLITREFSSPFTDTYCIGRSSDLDIFSILVLGFPAWHGGIHYYGVYNHHNSLFITSRLLSGFHQRERRAFEKAREKWKEKQRREDAVRNGSTITQILHTLPSLWQRISGRRAPPYELQSFAGCCRVWSLFPSSLFHEISIDMQKYSALVEEETFEEVVKTVRVYGTPEVKLPTSRQRRVSFNTTKLEIWE